MGAGGLSNAFPKLVNDAGRGAVFDLKRVPVEESPACRRPKSGAAESQERLRPGGHAARTLTRFDDIARRERCPYAVVGVATEERQLRVVQGEGLPGVDAPGEAAGPVRPVDAPIDVILGKPPRMTRDGQRLPGVAEPLDLAGIDLTEAAYRVLRHPTVANKTFLITIGDRNVGGLSARDQMVGPWQVPVADCAVTLADYEGFRGEAMAMGERTPVAMINAPASGRMAVAEALTNLAAADVRQVEHIKLSANWTAACGVPGQDAALYDTVSAVSELCQTVGLSIPVAAIPVHEDVLVAGRRAAPGGRAGVADRHRLRAGGRCAGKPDAAPAHRRGRHGTDPDRPGTRAAPHGRLHPGAGL